MENNLWKVIKAETFFYLFLPQIKNFKHKIRGKSGRNKPLTFSDEDNELILWALEELKKDYEKYLKTKTHA